MGIGAIIGGIGAAAAAKQAFDPETPSTTTTTQVDPQTQAMQQDLYQKVSTDCTTAVYTLYRSNGCWFLTRPTTTVPSY